MPNHLLKSLHPRFKEIILSINAELIENGIQPEIVAGLRTPLEQARLYSVGRGNPEKLYTVGGITITTPALYQYPEWNVLTGNQPFKSPHNWGIAVDYAWVIDGEFTFTAPRNVWKKLHEVAKKYDAEDITKSISWDKNHIQWREWTTIRKNLNRYKELYFEGGYEAAWAELDRSQSQAP
jgi:hypothetical protein